MKKINDDGLPEGGFSENKNIPYPRPLYGKETYAQYRERVSGLVKQGFHLGDLSWGDWDAYCKGSGMFDLGNGNIFDADKII